MSLLDILPFYLMYGRHSRLPVDLVFRRKVEDDEPAHAEDVVEEDTSSESEDDMPSFSVLRHRPVPATRPIPASL